MSTVAHSEAGIEQLLHTENELLPPKSLVENARLKDYAAEYKWSVEDPEAFWAAAANELEWFQPWTKVFEWKYPTFEWFQGGKFNITYNCLDRQVKSGRKNKVAYIWVGEDGTEQQITYSQLLDYVCRTANVYVLLESGLARNWKMESSPVGTLPPIQVTFWITAFSPEPVCWSRRFHPVSETNESMPKPLGSVSSIFVVVRRSFSVGTASVNSCRVLDLVTGGLISACAQALETTVRPAAATAAPTSARARTRIECMLGLSFRQWSRDRLPRRRQERRGGPRAPSGVADTAAGRT